VADVSGGNVGLVALAAFSRNRCFDGRRRKLTLQRASDRHFSTTFQKVHRLAARIDNIDLARTRRYILGLGCERGALIADVAALAARALQHAGIGHFDILELATIDTKTAEPAILAVAAQLDVSIRFFDAATLEMETPRLKNPSDLVFARVGCHGVAEAAALAAAGSESLLVLPKIKSAFATAAIAEIGR
jgi:cobalt-precorrin 5A hydrolase